jgi:hypothetical protein
MHTSVFFLAHKHTGTQIWRLIYHSESVGLDRSDEGHEDMDLVVYYMYTTCVDWVGLG